jgi:CRP-like cAMP-binding protein
MNAQDPSQRFAREFPRGAVVFREGETGGPMYVVQRGRVRIAKRTRDGELPLAVLGPGEFFGEMSILSGQPRSATATCEEDSRLLVVEARSFEGMLRANGEIAVRMIRELASRLARADAEIERLARPTPSPRRGGA